MSLHEALARVSGYRPEAGRTQPAQEHLSATARTLVADVLPPTGFTVRVSGSGQTLPKVPWIAVLDPDVTKTAKAGLYLVYLFDVRTEHVSQYEPGREEGWAPTAAGLLILAGPDRDLLQLWVDTGRERGCRHVARTSTAGREPPLYGLVRAA